MSPVEPIEIAFFDYVGGQTLINITLLGLVFLCFRSLGLLKAKLKAGHTEIQT